MGEQALVQDRTNLSFQLHLEVYIDELLQLDDQVEARPLKNKPRWPRAYFECLSELTFIVILASGDVQSRFHDPL